MCWSAIRCCRASCRAAGGDTSWVAGGRPTVTTWKDGGQRWPLQRGKPLPSSILSCFMSLFELHGGRVGWTASPLPSPSTLSLSPTYLFLSLIFCPYNADGRGEGLAAQPPRYVLPMPRRCCIPLSLQCRLPTHPTAPDPTRSTGSMHHAEDRPILTSTPSARLHDSASISNISRSLILSHILDVFMSPGFYFLEGLKSTFLL
jgi:hypothetical protein